MVSSFNFVGLDVGEKRIGVAVADTTVRIARPLATLSVDGTELEELEKIVREYTPRKLVLGYPRNQQGETTSQTHFVETFARLMESFGMDVDFQDESLTSVMAEQRLKERGKPFEKGDIDAEAAVIILQDYVEQHYRG